MIMEQEQKNGIDEVSFVDLTGLWSSSTGRSFTGKIQLSTITDILSRLTDDSKYINVVLVARRPENPKAPSFSLSAKIQEKV